MARFALEIKQTGVWLHKGEYAAQRTALQGGRNRFPGLSLRIIDRETGNLVFTLENDQVQQPVQDDNYGFASSASFMNMVDDDAIRFKNTEDWHQKFTQRRNDRIQIAQRARESLARLRLQRMQQATPAPEIKVRRPHIKWNVDGF